MLCGESWVALSKGGVMSKKWATEPERIVAAMDEVPPEITVISPEEFAASKRRERRDLAKFVKLSEAKFSK